MAHMDDFERPKTRRREPQRCSPGHATDPELLELRVSCALTSVREKEQLLKDAWDGLWIEIVQKIKNVLFSPEGDTHRLHTPQTSSAAAVQDTKPSKEDSLSVVEHQLRGVKLSDDDASAMLATQSGSTWRTPSVAARILCLGLGKPATDRVAQNQLALLLLITSSLEVPSVNVEVYDPMWEIADVMVIRGLGMTASPSNLRGHQSLQLSTTPYLLFMPHCPRPLYEAILIENWNSLQRPGSRWVLLGNDLIDYVPHAASAHVRASDKSADGMVVVKSRRKRRVRSGALKCLPGNSALERLAPHLTSNALPKPPSGMENAFASLRSQWLTLESLSMIDWEKPLQSGGCGVDDEAGEVIRAELPFAL